MTLYNKKDEELDIFREIHEKIAQVVADRKVVESRMEEKVDSVLATFEEYNFKFAQQEKHFDQLKRNTE